MIALDSSALIAYLSRFSSPKTEIIDAALAHHQAVLPPPVLTELLSDPKLEKEIRDIFVKLPLLEVSEGYWERSGLTRSIVIRRGFKARVADALIAQSCIDSRIPLCTLDKDFWHFEKWCGLKLV